MERVGRTLQDAVHHLHDIQSVDAAVVVDVAERQVGHLDVDGVVGLGNLVLVDVGHQDVLEQGCVVACCHVGGALQLDVEEQAVAVFEGSVLGGVADDVVDAVLIELCRDDVSVRAAAVERNVGIARSVLGDADALGQLQLEVYHVHGCLLLQVQLQCGHAFRHYGERLVGVQHVLIDEPALIFIILFLGHHQPVDIFCRRSRGNDVGVRFSRVIILAIQTRGYVTEELFSSFQRLVLDEVGAIRRFSNQPFGQVGICIITVPIEVNISLICIAIFPEQQFVGLTSFPEVHLP